jgi:tetratricopeptide (TPR) repeat protein
MLIGRDAWQGFAPRRAFLLCSIAAAAMSVIGCLISSAWLALLGLWLQILAAAMSVTVRPRSLYPVALAMPWLFLAGLPDRIADRPGTALTVRTMQQILSNSAANNRLVWTEGNILKCIDGALNIPDFLFSPAGLPLILVGCWIVAVRSRRSSMQSMLMYTAGGLWSLLLTVQLVRFAAQLPWLLPESGDSPAWLLLCTQAVLMVALVRLCDLAAVAITQPILTHALSATTGQNPWIRLWNRFISGQASESMHQGAEYRGHVTAGGFRLLLRTLPDAIVAWYSGRSPARLAAATGFLALPLFVLSLQNDPQALQKAISAVGNIADSARSANDIETEEQALRMLISLQPAARLLRFQLAQLLWAAGHREECHQLLTPLIADGPQSLSAARYWLVKNSLLADPLVPLTDEDRIRHLRAVTNADPGHTNAAMLLSRLYRGIGEFSLAEKVLTAAADASPANLHLLVQFFSETGLPVREPLRFKHHLENLRRQFQQSSPETQDPTQLAQLLLMLNQLDEAASLTISARSNSDSPELRQLEARIRIRRVTQTATREFLKPQALLDDVNAALRLQPNSDEALHLAVLMQIAEGAVFAPDVAKAVLDHLQTLPVSSENTARQGLAHTLLNDFEETVRVLLSTPNLQPVHRLALVHALRRTRSAQVTADAATAAINALGPLAAPESRKTALLIHMTAGQLEFPPQLQPATTDPDFAELQALLAQFRFDQTTGYPGDLSPAVGDWKFPTDVGLRSALDLLGMTLQHPTTQAAASRRLCRLRKSGPQPPKIFDRWLLQTRATLGNPQQMLLIAGTMASEEQAWDDAVYWLDAAVRSATQPNPAALNNLAVAIVRGQQHARYAEALLLIDHALENVPENPDLLASRAEVYIALRKWHDALTDLQNVLKKVPQHRDALLLLPSVNAALVAQ